MRGEYLFDLARVCHLRATDVDALTLTDFAVYTDCVDEWIKFEMKLLQARG